MGVLYNEKNNTWVTLSYSKFHEEHKLSLGNNIQELACYIKKLI